MNKSVLVVVLVLGVTHLVHSSFVYPTVRRNDSASYTLFGRQVLDPYNWLENSTSEETAQFVKDQNSLTESYTRTSSYWNSVEKSFKELYNYTRYGLPSKHGDWYYLSINTGLQNQAIIYRLKTLDNLKPDIFLDPNSFSSDGTVSLTFTSFSRDGKYCAYGISDGGSDWIRIKVKNTETLKDLNEVLIKIKFAYVGWNQNNDGFFYAYYDTYDGSGEGTDTETPLYQKLYYHRLNTQQSEDIKIHGFEDHPRWLIGTPVLSEDGRQIHLFPTEGTSNTPWLFSRFDPSNINNNSFKFEWIVPEANAEYFYVASTDKCTYVRTNYLAKNFRLICVDLDNYASSNWKDVLPSSEHVLSDTIVVNGDYLVAVYMIDVVNVIRIFNLTTGQFLFDVDTPIGTISSINGKRSWNEFFYKFTTFLSPGIIYHYNFGVKPNQIKRFKQSTISGLQTNNYETKQIFYTSKDGTRVPMFLVHPKGITLNGNNPTMLYAYGGFNINIQPDYNALGMFFVRNLDGVYAVANIRGGGEYGDDWHKAGMLLNKQNVFDDFASAGEWLINNGYTSRNYLTINGRSNGGLLVGASSNQRPDIFGNALANVGVMDMLKFANFTIGYAWIEEYGDPQNNETHFNYIHKYSPLHNINNDMNDYPNMLVLTADHDDRVVPAHSYKFIAQLQYTLGKKFPSIPLMIRVDANSGHGAGKPVSKWITEYTDIVCFLLKSANYQYHP